jgi:hypothetical protein
MSTVRVGLMLALALVVAVVANLVLLDVATGPNDPVGKLSPRAELIPLPPSARIVRPAPPPPRRTPVTTTTTAPAGTTTITPALPPPQPPTTTRRRGDGRRSGREQDD